MNYIRHLNAFFSFVRSDNRLTSSHVSLYMALFYYWNFNRFHNPFSIYRENLMQLSKIGSKNTYHKCIKELHEAKYIYYHPGTSKFQVVRISIVRLDLEEPTPAPYKQLDLFSSSPPLTDSRSTTSLLHLEKVPEGRMRPGDLGGGLSTDFDTGTVPKPVPGSPNIDTGTVAKMGHSINQTNNKQNGVAKTHTKIFEKNRELNEKVNGLAQVSNLVPALQEVENYFKQNNASPIEAHKFFYYNQGKNWMLTEKLPVTDWKALAQKWMLNTNNNHNKQTTMKEEVQQLYESFLQGEKVNRFILPEFADHLQLEITEEIKQEAVQRRINQLSGSNEASETKLWTAYMKNDFSSSQILNDQSNIIALQKRIAVSKYFQQLKTKGELCIP